VGHVAWSGDASGSADLWTLALGRIVDMATDPKSAFAGYLQGARDGLIWKLDGLSERQVRLPMTPTGTNLLGLVKHAATWEAVYFGSVFGRPWPVPEDFPEFDTMDPHADSYAREDESREHVVDLYRRVQQHADETIASLAWDAVGQVPHWGGAKITLLDALIHQTCELQRHAGHADILREHLDGTVGLLPGNSNVPDGVDWPAHMARLRAIAESFA